MSEPNLPKIPLAVAAVTIIIWAVAFFVLGLDTILVMGIAIIGLGTAVGLYFLNQRDENVGGSSSPTAVFGPMAAKFRRVSDEPNYSDMTPEEKTAHQMAAKAEKKRSAQDEKFQRKAEKDAARAVKTAAKAEGKTAPKDDDIVEWLASVRDGSFAKKANPDGVATVATTIPPSTTNNVVEERQPVAGLVSDDFFGTGNGSEPERVGEQLFEVPLPETFGMSEADTHEESEGETADTREEEVATAVSWLYQDEDFLAQLTNLPNESEDDEMNVTTSVDSSADDTVDGSADDTVDGSADDTVDELFVNDSSDHDWNVSNGNPLEKAETVEPIAVDVAENNDELFDVVDTNSGDETVTTDTETSTVENSELSPPTSVENVENVEELDVSDDTYETVETGPPLLAVPGTYEILSNNDNDDSENEGNNMSISTVGTDLEAQTVEDAHPVLLADSKVASIANQIARLVADAEWEVEQRSTKQVEAVKVETAEQVRAVEEDADKRVAEVERAAQAQQEVVTKEAERKTQNAIKQVADLRRKTEVEQAEIERRHAEVLATKADRHELVLLAEQNNHLNESLEEAETNLQQVIDANRTVADAAATSARLQSVTRLRKLRNKMSEDGIQPEAVALIDAVIDDFRK